MNIKQLISYILLWVGVILPIDTLGKTENHSAPSFFETEQSLLREKLYIHTDKPYYAAGDTIWLRGTLVNADTHSYLVKSNYIYVELWNEKDSLIERRMLKRDGLCFHNCLPLSVELPEGEYLMRAYSKYMLNFDSNYFYSHRIHIGNTTKPRPIKGRVERDYHVTFFPEGGTLLAGIPQRVAFKVQSATGYSEAVTGEIYTPDNQLLTSFQTMHDGMGSFVITPPKEMTLKAQVKAVRDGLEREFPLPKAKTKGIALCVERPTEDKLIYRLLKPIGQEHHEGLRLITHCRSRFLEEHVLGSADNGVIDISHYPDGIVHLIVCNANGEALTRRLVFVNNNQAKSHWKFSSDKPMYNTREKVRLDFILTDDTGTPLRGDFSLSITDAKTIKPNHEADNIVSNLLMTSDLKGFIENPAWYFADANDTLRTAMLDLVMLTHGWSRFNTDSLHRKPSYNLSFPIEVGQDISGRVQGIPKKEKGNMISALAFTEEGEREFATGKVQSDGNFVLSPLDIPNDRRFALKLLSKKKMGRRILVNRDTFPTLSHKEPLIMEEWMYAENKQKNYLTDGLKHYMLPDVQILSKKSSHKALKNLFVRGRVGHEEINLYNDPNRVGTALDLFDRLATERYPGYFFSPYYNSYTEANSDTESSSADGSTIEGTNWKPFWGTISRLYVNNDEYDGFHSISTALTRIQPADIERIEFVSRIETGLNDNRETIMGQNDEIVMVLFMREGFNYQDEGFDPRRIVVTPFGYSENAYFYHPIYETPKANYPSEDARTTLYWNPSIQTDIEGHCAAIFYTSDFVGNYHVVIEGVTIDGHPCRFETDIMGENRP